jgi:hypothetical protein
MTSKRPVEFFPLIGRLKQSIWFLGVSSWLFGVADRTLAALSDGILSALDIGQLLTTSLCLLGWIFLKPKRWK